MTLVGRSRLAALALALSCASSLFAAPAPARAEDPPPAPAEGGKVDKTRVSGRVIDDTGKPVAGARVSILMSDRVFAVTDAQGQFALTGVDPEAAMVLFTVTPPPGTSYFPSGGPMAEPGRTDVELTLERGGALEGVVRRKSDGGPVEGAYVWCGDEYGAWHDLRTFRPGEAAPDAPPLPFARTDAQGRFKLSPVRPSDQKTVVAVSPELAIDAKDLGVAAGATATIEISLGAGAALSGRVLDAQGEPVPGAVVVGDWPRESTGRFTDEVEGLRAEAIGATKDETDYVGSRPPTKLPAFLFRKVGRTDDDGRFRFSRLPAGRRTIAVAAPDFLPVTASVELTDGGPAQTIDVRLVPCGSLAAVVRFKGGALVQSGNVDIVRLSPDGSAPGTQKTEYLSEAGAVRFDFLEGGRYIVSGRMSERLEETGRFEIDRRKLRDDPIPPQVIVVEPGKTLRLDLGSMPEGGPAVVVHAKRRGGPAAGVPVVLRLDAAPEIAFRVGLTDAEGRCRLAAVVEGPLTLEIGHTQRKVVLGRAEKELAVHADLPGGGIRGTVKRADGGAVTTATATIARLATPTAGLPESLDMLADGLADPVVVDAQGRIEVAGLPPGRYRLDVGAEGLASAVARLDVTDADATIELRLEREGRIHALLGLKAEEARSLFYPHAIAIGETGETYRQNAPFQGSGFDFVGLPAGTYTLAVVTPMGDMARLGGVKVSAGALVEARVPLGPTGALEALVTGPGGAPATDALVLLFFAEGPLVPFNAMFFPTPIPVGPDGHARQERIAPGPYVVRARMGEGGAWVSAPLEVKAGETASVKVELPK